MARSQSDLHQIVEPEEVESLLKRYEKSEIEMRQEKESLNATKAANLLLQEEIRAAQYTMIQLQEQTQQISG